MQFHALDYPEVLRSLATGAGGLTSEEAAARARRYGPNRLTLHRGRSPLQRLLQQFHNLLIYLLLGAVVITALLQHWVDTGVIVGVVVINALIGFIQEGKAEQALAAIRRLLSLKAVAWRDQRQVLIPAEQLVPGDVVLLQSGDRVPADLRLLQVKNLRIEEASLTGESLPAEKDIAPVALHAPLGDRACMAYAGTLVRYGQGSGVVVATGDRTEIGRISELLAEVERIETPLLRRIAGFSKWLSAAIVTIAVATFFIGVRVRDYSAADMFMAAVGLAVAAIPEGLPAIMTITLAIGVQRMARRNAIIRLLPAVETLGSVTCICSDKTGTLTRNEMTVQTVATRTALFQVSGVGYEPHGEFLLHDAHVNVAEYPDVLELLRAGLLCNDASLDLRDGQWHITGDPTEAALVVAARKAGFESMLESESWPRTDVIPFESEHRFMATLHHDHAGHGMIYVKGAPERILEMCGWERTNSAQQPLHIEYWHQQLRAMTGQGQRVLALACKPAQAWQRELRFSDVADGLTLLGLCGMVDPPREEAVQAVADCRAAGIRVRMITGDHAATALAVAGQLGIGDGKSVLTSAEIETMSEAALTEAAVKTDVYARVSPEHKLRLVKALQSRGEIVAMTGDGVNDAPALKRADVGVAMGVSGTEVAKEAAEMVLADDNFASIVNAIEEGRTVYDNLRKTLLFIMPTNGGEAFTLITAIALGLTLPILPVQILWANMVTAVTLALALAFEPTEPDTMRRPPRDPRAPLFSRYFLWRTLLVTALITTGTLGMFLWEQAQGASLEAARTAAVTTLVMFEAVYLLNSRRLLDPAWPQRAFSGDVHGSTNVAGGRMPGATNPYIALTIVLVVLLQLLYVYAPFMQTLFHSASLGAEAWLRIILIALSIYVIVEFEKGIVRAMNWRVV
ncbi:MAG: cation-transporting P-type ATPase [Gammaproteobacteria bacterium]|nr:MAG: cation-transporting P-type ATPase [Gammaproteobacteria bacterium]